MDSKDEIINGLDGTSDGWETTFTHDEVKKAMDIHAKQISIAFMMWYGGNDKESCTRLYEMFEQHLQSLNNIQP